MTPDTLFPFVGASYTGSRFKSWDAIHVSSCVAVGRYWIMTAGHAGLGPEVTFQADATHEPSSIIRVDRSSRREFKGLDVLVYQTLDPIPRFCRIASVGPSCATEASVTSEGESFHGTGTNPDHVVWVGYGPGGEETVNHREYAIDWKSSGFRHAAIGRADFSGQIPGVGGMECSVWGGFLRHAGDPVVNGGDSGGAVLLRVGSEYQLVGIISFRQGTDNTFSIDDKVHVASVSIDVTGLRGQIDALPNEPAHPGRVWLAIGFLATVVIAVMVMRRKLFRSRQTTHP